jgi:hypothetical protein
MENWIPVFGIPGLAIVVCVAITIRNRKKGNDWF